MRAKFAAALGLWMMTTVCACAQPLSASQVDTLPTSRPQAVVHYGPAPQQMGELRLPRGKGPFPVAIVIHGGCWTSGFETLAGTAPIASALARAGVATWNIEYRQVGGPGGGWPGTFQDWGAAADYLRVLARTHPLDLTRVVTVGHSAGGHAALWLAARQKLPINSPIRGAAPLAVKAAVSIDGVGDLADFVGPDAERCGQSVVAPLTGGTPAQVPDRFRQASPYALQPLGIPQDLVVASFMSPDEAQRYRDHGAALGDWIQILTLPASGHFEPIAPGQPEWAKVQALILRAFSRQSRCTPAACRD